MWLEKTGITRLPISKLERITENLEEKIYPQEWFEINVELGV